MLSKKNIFLVSLLSGFFFSCSFTGGNVSKVRIIANPYGEGDEIRTGDFIVYVNGGSFNCRPSTPDINTIRPFLQKNGLLGKANSGLLDILGLEVETSETAETDTSGTSAKEEKEPVKVEVGEGWLKLGFEIRNNSDHHLIVTDIVFNAVGEYKGEIFPYQNNISIGYCDSPFANALYFVPKKSIVEYKPASKDILTNMAIYIDGFPFINRITGEGAGGRRAAPAETAQGEGTSGPLSPLTADPDIARGCFISVPRYRMEVLFRGYFVTSKGSRLSAFGYRLFFGTKSLNEC